MIDADKTLPKWIIEGDIKSCLDKISHDWILENILIEKDVMKKFLKVGYLFDEKLFPTTEGSAQDGIISSTIANKVKLIA